MPENPRLSSLGFSGISYKVIGRLSDGLSFFAGQMPRVKDR